MLTRVAALSKKVDKDLLMAGALGAAALILYVATLSPDVLGGDPGEAQLAPYLLGIMHYTGYPLYTLVGWLWSHLVPFGNVAYRMNLLSAIFAAATISLVYLGVRQITIGYEGAALAAMALAVSPLFWEWAIMAGVRSLNAFFVATTIYLALRWQKERKERDLRALALVYGLSLTHHRTMILIGPALIIFALLVDRKLWREPKRLWLLIVLLGLPLLLYLYLPIRSRMHPPFDLLHPDNLERFLDLVTARKLSAFGETTTLNEILDRVRAYGLDLSRQFHVIGLLLGILGAFLLLWQDARTFLLFFLGFLGVVTFTVTSAYHLQTRPTLYAIPANVLFALWIGSAVDTLGKKINDGLSWPRARTLVSLGVFVLLALTGVNSYRQLLIEQGFPLDAYRQQLRWEQGRRLATNALPYLEPNSLMIADWEQATVFWYLQLIEGLRQDVWVQRLISEREEEQFRFWLENGRSQGKPVYVARVYPYLLGEKHLTSAGPVLKIQNEPSIQVPEETTPSDVNLEDQLKLVGYRHWSQRFRPGEVLSLILYWQALDKMENNYSVSVRLYDPNGNQVAQLDYAHPVLGTYPTTLWTPGEVVGDYYELPLDHSLAEGLYDVVALVYTSPEPGKWYNLQVKGTTPPTDRITLGSIEVRR
ncbi:MAG: DUF2723 domain-containing protein [Anaerolineae bacterium]